MKLKLRIHESFFFFLSFFKSIFILIGSMRVTSPEWDVLI